MKIRCWVSVKPVDATSEHDVIVYRREFTVPWGAPPRIGDEVSFYPQRFDEEPWKVETLVWDLEDGSATIGLGQLDARSIADQGGWEHRQMTNEGWVLGHANLRSDEDVIAMKMN